MPEQGTNRNHGEPLWRSTESLFPALYQEALDLGYSRPLTLDRYNELLADAGLGDMIGRLTPEIIIPLVSADSLDLTVIADIGRSELAALSNKNGLDEARIWGTAWPARLTTFHLLGMTGMPVNDAMSRIYPQPKSQLVEEAA